MMMNVFSRAWLLAIGVLFLQVQHFKAGHLLMRPLKSDEVYRLLREAGREDAVPEGRIVSQGIAAVTGFTLGVTKGIAGSILFDIITANITGLLGNVNNAGVVNTTVGTSAQEICFNTRSLDDVEVVGANNNQAEDDNYDDGNEIYDDDYAVKHDAAAISSQYGYDDYQDDNDHDVKNYENDHRVRQVTTINTGTGLTSPTVSTSTQVGNGAGVTCIVVPKRN